MELDLPSALVAVGPFGDMKNYNGRDFYLAWYPAWPPRVTTSNSLSPRPLQGWPVIASSRRCGAVLARSFPVSAAFDEADDLVVAGGFVFARGAGSIGDARSGLHRRDRFGVQRVGSFFSVDTGKYSTAPWLAELLAAEILA